MYLAITELLSGLALFLVGMKFMSENLQQLAGNKLRDLLERFTKQRIPNMHRPAQPLHRLKSL